MYVYMPVPARIYSCTDTYMHIHTPIHAKTCMHATMNACTRGHVHVHSAIYTLTHGCSWSTHMHLFENAAHVEDKGKNLNKDIDVKDS